MPNTLRNYLQALQTAVPSSHLALYLPDTEEQAALLIAGIQSQALEDWTGWRSLRARALPAREQARGRVAPPPPYLAWECMDLPCFRPAYLTFFHLQKRAPSRRFRAGLAISLGAYVDQYFDQDQTEFEGDSPDSSVVADRLASIVDQAQEVLVVVDREGRVLYANPAYTSKTGYPGGQFVGRLWEASFQADPKILFEDIVAIAMREGAWQGQLKCRTRRARTVVLEAVISPLFNAEGQAADFLISCRDVMRERYLEQQLYQAQKMESLGLMAGGIAHDFNNVLQIITGNATMEQETREEDGLEPSPLLSDLLEATDRASRIIRQLMTFGHRQPIQRENLDLNQVVVNCFEHLQRWIGPAIEVNWVPSPTPVMIEGDIGQIEQILFNLGVNARDAMPKGGDLKITLEPLGKHHPYPQIPGGACRLRISDSGKGIQAEYAHRIFDPFFTTKGNKGTGLGLSVVYGIIRHHGGNIELVDEFGRGACFDMIFPVVAAAPAVKPTESNKTGPQTVLIADDEPMLRILMTKILEKRGLTVLVARDGREAVELYKQNSGDITALVFDVVMPRMSGRQALEEIRSYRPDIPAMLCTGYCEESESILKGLGDVNLLSKPYSTKDFLLRLNDMLGKVA